MSNNKKKGSHLFNERLRKNLENTTYCYASEYKGEGLVPKEECKCFCEGQLKDLCHGKADKDRYHKRREELEKDPSINSLDMMMKVLDKEFEGSAWYRNMVRGAFGNWDNWRD